nr:N-6 DNA methylase [Enterococcus cecorum]
MAKKKTTDNVLNIDNILFKCRDILRAARNSGSFFEKRDIMLTLVFLRFIGEKYEDGIEKLRQTLIEQGLDPEDENIQAAFFEDATFTDGTYNLAPEARWSTIINTPAPGLNVALDTALNSIANSSEDLKGCFVEGTFTNRNLAPNDIKKLVDEVNKISHKSFGEEKDLIGRVYEYFLKEFAVNATKEEGEFYTPHDAVQLIASMIEPYDGTLYDPCCGSAGMFIQSAALVKARQGDINRINIYGQEKEPATYRLAKMNLALRGLSHHLGDEADSTFSHDLHKGIYFDYIMANPPFNLKGWYNSNLENDPRWADYATPPASNANYAWILHMLSHLKPSK